MSSRDWYTARGFWRDGSPLDGLKDLMWMHIIERGQAPRPRVLKGYVYDLIQAMSQMTGGEHSSSKADYIGFDNIRMLTFSIICEVTALVKAGALGSPADPVEELAGDTFWAHDTYPWKTMDKHRTAGGPSDAWSYLRPGGQESNVPLLKASVSRLIEMTWGRRQPLPGEVTELDNLAAVIVMESIALVLSGDLDKEEQSEQK